MQFSVIGKTGVNAGLILFDIEKFKSLPNFPESYLNYFNKVYQRYQKSGVKLAGDQDILNIMFSQVFESIHK